MRSNSAWSTKWYSTPSLSPGRGARVVTLTDSQTSGCRRRSDGDDAALADAGGAGQDGEPAGGAQEPPNSRSSASRCLAPSPRTRRDGEISRRSMICCARTLPTPGHRLEHGDDLHLADDLVGVAVGEHLVQAGAAGLSRTFSAARARRAAAAFSRAAARCSGVRGGSATRLTSGRSGRSDERVGGRSAGSRSSRRDAASPAQARRRARLRDTPAADASARRREAPGRAQRRSSPAAIAAAAAPGSAAPVMGRPMTSRSAPSASACSGVATRAWSCTSAPAGRTPGRDEHDVGADLGADRGDLLRRADQRAGAGADGERGQPADGVQRRAGQADGVERRRRQLVRTVTAAIVTSGAASTAARTMSAPPAACTVR